MRKVKFILKIVTPLFMGGAFQQAELREASLNGMFRYWFRLGGGSKKDEMKIFGSGGETSQRKLFSLRIKNKSLIKQKFSKIFNHKGYVNSDYGINYLGFALDQRNKREQLKPQREFLTPGQKFELEITCFPHVSEEFLLKFLCALWLSFNLGNFGSRARRGFGSIKIEKIEGLSEDEKLKINFVPGENLESWLKENLNKIKEILFSECKEGISCVFDNGNFSIYKIKKQNWNRWKSWIKDVQNGRKGKYLIKNCNVSALQTYDDYLNFMGFLLAAYRSYYQPDYATAKGILIGSGVKNPCMEKAIFGLPLNFYFSSLRKKGSVNLKLQRETLRRASPLWFKILEKENEEIEGLFIVMKSPFLPNGGVLRFQNSSVNLPSPNLWKSLDNFLESLIRYQIIQQIL